MGNVDIQNDLILPEKNDNIKKKNKKKKLPNVSLWAVNQVRNLSQLFVYSNQIGLRKPLTPVTAPV